MRYRILDSNGDYSFGNGSQDFYFNVPAAVAQAVQTGLTLWLGEWYLDQTQGMNWLEGVLGKYSQAQADQAVQTQILNTQGVNDIASFSSTGTPGNRNYAVTECTVDTVYGPTPVQIAYENIF